MSPSPRHPGFSSLLSPHNRTKSLNTHFSHVTFESSCAMHRNALHLLSGRPVRPSLALLLLALLLPLSIASAAPNTQRYDHSSLASDLVSIARSASFRTYLKSALASSSRQAADTPLFTCRAGEAAGSRVRKDFRDLTPFELWRWRNATRRLVFGRPASSLVNFTTENGPPSFWDLLVAIHIIYRDEAHGGSYFLPWHRFFLLYLENYIRDNMFARFTLPYWDWSFDAADAARSQIWTWRYLGRSVQGPIASGPFRNSQGYYLEPHLVTRGFNSRSTGAIPPLVTTDDIERFVNRENLTYAEFSDAWESEHDLLHFYIGGDMESTITSTNDPVFYAHHAFVDKVWWDRQRITGNFTDFGGTHDFFPEGELVRSNASSDFVFEYFELPVREALNQACVSYQPYSGIAERRRNNNGGSGSAPPGTAPDVSPTALESEEEGEDVNNRPSIQVACAESDMMETDRCLSGQAVMADV